MVLFLSSLGYQNLLIVFIYVCTIGYVSLLSAWLNNRKFDVLGKENKVVLQYAIIVDKFKGNVPRY